MQLLHMHVSGIIKWWFTQCWSPSLSATRAVPTFRWESLNLINTQTAERSSPQNPGYTSQPVLGPQIFLQFGEVSEGLRTGREGTVSWKGWVINEKGVGNTFGGEGSGVTIGKQE